MKKIENKQRDFPLSEKQNIQSPSSRCGKMAEQEGPLTHLLP